MNTQQAYIEGFVKRAMEHGFSESVAVELLKTAKKAPEDHPKHSKEVRDKIEQLKKRRFGGGGLAAHAIAPPAGWLYDAISDANKPDEAPSRFLHSSLGSMGGSVLAAGLNRALGMGYGLNSMAIQALGAAAGGSIHNDKLQQAIAKLEASKAGM